MQVSLSALDEVRQTAIDAARGLRECMSRVREMLEQNREYDDKLASHYAWLSQHLAGLLRELRQMEKHDRAAVKAFTPEERDRHVRAYIAELAKERRADFRNMLDALDREELLLS